ncbi:MAG: hypothetical protein ABL966_03945 [Acidimicrobiales bacterium]
MFRKLVPALVAPLLLTASCATEADDAALRVYAGPEAVATVRALPEAVAAAGTSAFEMVMDFSLDGESFQLLASGVSDPEAQRMSIEVHLGDLFAQLAAGSGEALPEGFDGPMQLVADGSTFYLRAPILEMIAGGSGWLSMSAEDLGSTADGLGVGAYDPATILEALRGVTGEPTVVGPEVVRGVDTTRYTANLDLAEAIASAPESQRERLEAQLEQLGSLDGTAVPVDVWIDGDGLPRRVQMDMAQMFAALGAGDDAVATMTMELFAFGDPVEIEVPSPDEVTPFTDVMGGLGTFGLAGS